MSIREGLLAAGIVILVIVVADLVRRYLQRNKLRLAIDKKFQNFPAEDLSSELPNGGARVVSKTAAAMPPVTSDPDGAAASANSVAESQSTSSNPDAWIIDPRLSGRREPDEAVDLLLEREFKGLGEGASRWLNEAETSSAADPSAKPSATPSSQPLDALDNADLASLAAEDAEAPRNAFEDKEQLHASFSMLKKADVNADSSSDKATLGLVAAADVIDLERPVHELLQARQQAGLSTNDSSSTLPANSDTEAAGSEVKKGRAAPAPQPPETAKASTRAASASKEELQPSFFDIDPGLAPAVEAPAAKPKSRRRKKKAQQAEAVPTAPDSAPEALLEDEVLIINVLAKRGPFSGPILFKLVEACGLEFGDRDIYHRYEEANGRGALQFSMANAVRPGTFDPSQQLPQSTPAVTFFLCLSDPTDRMTALECMLATAKCVADNLGGELKDEHRSSLRTQTIEHYRQKVREFERKALTRRR